MDGPVVFNREGSQHGLRGMTLEGRDKCAVMEELKLLKRGTNSCDRFKLDLHRRRRKRICYFVCPAMVGSREGVSLFCFPFFVSLFSFQLDGRLSMWA